MARNYAALFHEYLEEFADLTDAEFGRLARALLVYSRTGEFPALNGNERFFKRRIMMQEDRFKREEDEALALEEERRAKGRSQAQERMRRYRERMDNVTESYDALRVTERNEASHTVTEKEKESAPLSPPSLSPPITPVISPPYNPPTEKEKETVCAESLLPKRSTPPIITLTLNDGTEYPVSEEQCQEWAGLYPAVDVIQQLRQMRAWLDANPAKRKTKRGIKAFIVNWLSRAQDKGRAVPKRTENQPFTYDYGDLGGSL